MTICATHGLSLQLIPVPLLANSMDAPTQTASAIRWSRELSSSFASRYGSRRPRDAHTTDRDLLRHGADRGGKIGNRESPLITLTFMVAMYSVPIRARTYHVLFADAKSGRAEVRVYQSSFRIELSTTLRTVSAPEVCHYVCFTRDPLFTSHSVHSEPRYSLRCGWLRFRIPGSYRFRRTILVSRLAI